MIVIIDNCNRRTGFAQEIQYIQYHDSFDRILLLRGSPLNSLFEKVRVVSFMLFPIVSNAVGKAKLSKCLPTALAILRCDSLPPSLLVLQGQGVLDHPNCGRSPLPHGRLRVVPPARFHFGRPCARAFPGTPDQTEPAPDVIGKWIINDIIYIFIYIYI